MKLTNASLFQDIEFNAFNKLNCPDYIERFIKSMLINHPEDTVCNTILNGEDFQLMRNLIIKSQETSQPLTPIENDRGQKSEFFIDYEFHQGEL